MKRFLQTLSIAAIGTVLVVGAAVWVVMMLWRAM